MELCRQGERVERAGQGRCVRHGGGRGVFSFHPITLISGSYITAADLMQDRALLDEETAWLLFGGTDIQDMTFKINGVPFVVAGVIEREQDFATKSAYTDGMGIFISYDAWVTLNSSSGEDSAAAGDSASSGTTAAASTSSTGIQCYEVVLPNPVKNFAVGVVREKFPIGRGEIVNNTERFGTANLWQLIRGFGTRSMQTRGVIYPYWENAARGVEDRAALLLLGGIAALVLPCVTALVYIVKYAIVGKRRLEEDVLPRWRDSAEEAIRVQGRRRWEKKARQRQPRGVNMRIKKEPPTGVLFFMSCKFYDSIARSSENSSPLALENISKSSGTVSFSLSSPEMSRMTRPSCSMMRRLP